MPSETELKLQLNPRHIDRLRHRPPLAKAVCTEVDIENVYFDTSARLLRRHQMTLRLRRIDGRWVQTLKTGGGGAGALSRRGEWETPARALRGQGRLDLARLAAAPLDALLARQKRPAVLRPVFRTRVRRAQWVIERAEASVEVALDVGEITGVRARDPSREPICEVELELKKGEPAALIELAFELLDLSGKRTPMLTPAARSKAERGYQLVADSPATSAKASSKVFTDGLTPNTTTSLALRKVVAHGIAILTENVELMLRYGDPECVHQARVALRRVRSAIRLFDREHCDVPPAFADELQWFARALGHARDWDVMTDETLPSLAGSIDAVRAHALIAKAEQRRAHARRRIRSAARSSRYTALILNGERWCMTSPPRAALLAAIAAPTLQRLATKLLQAARLFSALTRERRHRVRIFAKRLRYALDLFAVVLPKQATARYIGVLAELQDALGQLNDASVALSVLPQLSRSAQLKKSVRAWSEARGPERVRDAERNLLKLSTLRTPWK